MRKAEISIKLDDETVKILYMSLLPETKSTIAPDSKVEISLRPRGEVFLSIRANTTSTLRALINAYLLWIHSIVEMLKGV